jgi:hypothetical protein
VDSFKADKGKQVELAELLCDFILKEKFSGGVSQDSSLLECDAIQ